MAKKSASASFQKKYGGAKGKTFFGGMLGKAEKSLKGRRAQLDEAIEGKPAKKKGK